MMSEQARRRAIAGRLHANRASIAASVTDEFLESHLDWLDRYPRANRAGGCRHTECSGQVDRRALREGGRCGRRAGAGAPRVTEVRHEAYEVLMDSWYEPEIL